MFGAPDRYRICTRLHTRHTTRCAFLCRTAHASHGTHPPTPHTNRTRHTQPCPLPRRPELPSVCDGARARDLVVIYEHAAARGGSQHHGHHHGQRQISWHPAQLDASHAPHAERTAGSHPRARRRRHAQLLAIRRSSSAGSHMRCAACVPSAVHRPTATAGLQACLRRRSWNRLLRISFGRSRSASKSMDSRSYSLPVTVHTNFAAIFHIASPVHHHEVGDEVATLPRQAGGVEFRYGSRAGGRRSQGGGYI